MPKKYKVAAGFAILGYLISLFTSGLLPGGVNLLVPTAFSLGSIFVLSRSSYTLDEPRSTERLNNQTRPPEVPAANSSSAVEPEAKVEQDTFWGPVMEYIHVIEEMVISESQKNTLDDEIVEKTLSLLSRVSRIIPQLKELNDGNMNHNIQRLIFKDLNGAINPFLKLGGEAKRLNRRLLLNGLRDINSKLSTYVETIEQKDLIELQTRMDLIQQRYRSAD
ncbi:hypothetical protein BC351_03615 [Paenibacillus ferrarius]|uniref:5-bromo-4-chloroindolyl phosphate hydrolysis protein n=1 Tax=Paenibacillus ferrarius TaxID=1469647 RepID=A0A1V4HKW2_9BACL|nr:hypothetical protein [Paenibacillus ferrarius]OPH57619.1 hypothetical protein BC351_03615 [Paenibacillus ferrarius]